MANSPFTFIRIQRRSFEMRSCPYHELEEVQHFCYMGRRITCDGKSVVWSPAFLCGFKTGTISEADKKKLEAFQMWCCRRMKKISWMDKISNTEVLKEIKEDRNIWKVLKYFILFILHHSQMSC